MPTRTQWKYVDNDNAIASAWFYDLFISQLLLSFVPDWSTPCRGQVRGVATPPLLCHKEPARRIQSPLFGALERKIPPLHWGLFCLLLAGSLLHKG